MSKGIQNHYLAGRQAWAEVFGSFIKERNLWRWLALLVSVVAILLGAGNIIQLRQQKVIPYMVEVDRAGRISGGHMAKKLETSQEMIQYSLGQFITAWRTVTADIALQEKYIKQSSFMSIGAAKRILAKWYADNNPYISSEEKLVEVRILALPLYVSGETWLVEWTEIERTHKGVERSRTTYQANLIIKRKIPETQQEIINNASGIYVSQISHSKKIQ
ncbi:type IV secretion system protein [Desulfobacter hydrogenophilus]|uniref:Type IV secretion system protein n=1 Tax=Desulfobacter hydrogenophilus TaxID=2291 RepID=A0A328FLB3_9BACT|nr:type IV secretion system protein [Desulfobacter hydrogenophilus]NDY73127.1 type IV secretion system protein [Desulfobacter hydrogenophilus]QBH14794.1 type IV secretion system protein [Desulfobacter hydrogenophilus]RAM03827.1 type IV secretion system protein [Desulfobacter hydrogenophilus]